MKKRGIPYAPRSIPRRRKAQVNVFSRSSARRAVDRAQQVADNLATRLGNEAALRLEVVEVGEPVSAVLAPLRAASQKVRPLELVVHREATARRLGPLDDRDERRTRTRCRSQPSPPWSPVVPSWMGSPIFGIPPAGLEQDPTPVFEALLVKAL